MGGRKEGEGGQATWQAGRWVEEEEQEKPRPPLARRGRGVRAGCGGVHDVGGANTGRLLCTGDAGRKHCMHWGL